MQPTKISGYLKFKRGGSAGEVHRLEIKIIVEEAVVSLKE
jgi:hypothetical protein